MSFQAGNSALDSAAQRHGTRSRSAAYSSSKIRAQMDSSAEPRKRIFHAASHFVENLQFFLAKAIF